MKRQENTLRIRAAGAALILTLLAIACQPSASGDSSPLPPSATPAPADDMPLYPTTTPVAGAEGAALRPTGTAAEASPSTGQEVVLLAKEDLAQRLKIAPERIVVRSVEPVTWPDTSLGCPQPGMMYAQVLTPGYRLTLEVSGQTYEFHTDRTQTIVLCTEEGSAMQGTTVPGPIEPGLEAFVDLAREDLAHRLSLPVGQIEVLEAKSVVWPDASLGCPAPGMRYRQVPMDGALIRLQAEGQVYEYHSGGSRGLFLCEPPLKLQKDTPPQLDLLLLTPDSPDD